jgi:hypothetical protein
VLVSIIFIPGAIFKLKGTPEVIDGFTKMGVPTNLITGIGFAELICVLLFTLPRTGVLGTVLLIGYMGGTIMAHIVIKEQFITNVIMEIFVGLVAYFRFPEIGGRLFNNAYNTN